jgi:proteasome accessory factor B
MSPAQAKLQRWVDILAALLSHRYPVSFERLVEEVPGYAGKRKTAQQRTFERDKRELRELGVPIETTIGEDGAPAAYRLSAANFYLPYLAVQTPRGPSKPRKTDKYGYHALKTLAFEPDELRAVGEAALRVRDLGDPTLRGHADSATRKLGCDVGEALRAPDDTRLVPARAAANAAVLDALGDALLRRKWVTFSYHAMERDVRATRRVAAYGLFFLSGHWYLTGCDLDRDELRNFRASRISGVVVNEARADSPDYQIPPGFNLREHARSRQAWELGDGEAVEATVEFRAETGAAVAGAALGEAAGGATADGVARRTFRVRRIDAFARWLLSFGGDAVPVVPDELVAEFRDVARRTLAVYRGGDQS